jgi:hypothetical protein
MESYGRRLTMLFKKRRGTDTVEADKKVIPAPATDGGKQDVELQEELDELTASESPKKVDRAKSDAERAISDATIADIRGITLIERGRCPDCGGRTELMVFSRVCPNCGWYRWQSRETESCVVFLTSGEKIRCDRVYDVKSSQLLLVRDDVVRTVVSQSSVARIDYDWDKEKLETAQIRFQKERTGVCDWCGIGFRELPEEVTPLEDYAAFGAFQERYRFCSEKCMGSFRRQYPTRIHRNCYETDCNSCDQCIKRFDTSQFKRLRL